MSKTSTKRPKSKHTQRKSNRIPPLATPQAALDHAVALSNAGRIDEALAAFDRAIDRFGASIDLLYNRGVTFQRIGLHREAIQSFIQIGRPSALVQFAVGISHQALGDFNKALRAYDRALELAPDHPQSLQNKGIIYQAQGRWDHAIEAHHAATVSSPTYADAFNSLGAALHGAGRDLEALEALDKALAISPNYTEALNNYGVSLQSLGRNDEALAYFDKAISASPASPTGFTNRAVCLADSGRVDEARHDYDAAIGNDVDCAMARFNRSLIALQRGDFEAGWRDYEYRALNLIGDPIPVASVPTWDGSPLPNGTLYVRTEQGAGDTIQFLRYLPFAKDRCGKIILECPKSLVTLAKTMDSIDEIVEKPTAHQLLPTPAGAVDVFLLSLPRIFNTRVQTIPWSRRYLGVPNNYMDIWYPRITTDRKRSRRIRIAIAWAGSPDHKNDRNRSCRIDDFAPLADIPGIELFSIQKGQASKDLYRSDIAPKILDLSYGLFDYVDTAAVCLLVDLVITVDTSVAHLAGALGKPVWTLLPKEADWRWMTERGDSPWYPTMHLFRQKTAGDWSSVFDEVRAQLETALRPTLSAAA